ncbi:hypothetical protein F8M41_013207 [Gigaspora margarita]|uniref:Uncharacterized protein n=1 Tax=Gigaspora margarita TaxID=4874 RepID=A0A8H4EPA0_GIGMA|nr:hypothetical protein F8M41_013207 [Gigaspora margarita]
MDYYLFNTILLVYAMTGDCSSHLIELESQTSQYPFIIGLDSTNNSTQTNQSFPDLSFYMLNISFTDVHSNINYRKIYIIVNGLSKKAIQTGLDTGANAIKELKDFINSFINKYASKKKSHLKKCKIQQKEEEETTSSCSSSDKKNFIKIKNLVVHSKRGASKKKRFKGSHELVSKKKSSTKEHSNAQKTRKQTQCQQCQNTGHKKASCEA